MTLDYLIDRYCAAWSDPDASARATLLDGALADGATYTDPTVHALDKAALLAHIAKIQATRPGAVVRRTTTIDTHHDHARFGFDVRSPDGTVLREGVDVVQLDAAGERLLRITGFFGALGAR